MSKNIIRLACLCKFSVIEKMVLHCKLQWAVPPWISLDLQISGFYSQLKEKGFIQDFLSLS